MVDFAFENNLAAQGYRRVCGVDEAGRGPVAGPVCAAAVVLPPGFLPTGLNDSKKLSEARREALFQPIMDGALAVGVAFATVEEIEELNILGATFLAMRRAVEQLTPPADYCIIDGNRLPPNLPAPGMTLVKGDARSASIAAASIIAKVTRDRYMRALDQEYPGYGFAGHKGYGTAAHRAAVESLGPCPAHRPSFLQTWLKR